MKNKIMKYIIKKSIFVFNSIEKWLLVGFMTLMILVAFSQILLRGTGVFSSFDALLKYIVLWTGMIAAGVATSENKNIKIDIKEGEIDTKAYKLIIEKLSF